MHLPHGWPLEILHWLGIALLLLLLVVALFLLGVVWRPMAYDF